MIEPARSARSFSLTVDGRPLSMPCDVVGSGPDALLLPALSSISARSEMWPLARDLGRDYRCLIPDWPGFGNQARAPLPMNPATMHAFLDALFVVKPGPYALAIAAGHASPYLVAAARRHPGLFGRIVLVGPTWRGPLPTAMGPERRGLFKALRRLVEVPLLGDAIYRINISRPVIGRMMRAHVYADPDHVTPGVIADKHAITRQTGARLGTAAFVTGGLDPCGSREAFLSLFEGPGLPPVLVLRPERAPRRSGAEMDALIATGRVSRETVPGALAAHEEYAGEVAEAVRGIG